MKRIFLTGGTGFFGRTLFDALCTGAWREYRWVVLSRAPEKFLTSCPEFNVLSDRLELIRGDIRDFEFPSGRFDAVVHGATPAVTTLADEEMSSIILDGTRRVLEFVRAAEVPRLLFALFFALLWIVSPVDLIPDAIPFFGTLDDAAVAILAALSCGRTLRH